jgi:plastocyanin
MILRSHICSECKDAHRGLLRREAGWSVLVGLLLVAPAPGGTIVGSVQLVDSHDSAVRKSRDFSGVVIWLERTDGEVLPLQPKTAQMAQRKKTFVPHVVAVPVGSTISFPNFDPIFHNVFSNFDGPVFDVGLYPPGNDQRVRFSRPGIVRVFCNIHLTMFAIVAILNTPYIAVSKSDGSFRVDEVKAGEYRLHGFHERATEETLKRLERTLMIGNDPVSLGSLEISESGYIAVPHKNKFGNDYPSVIEDHPMYPAGRNR